MPWARTARHLEAPIASQAPITAIIGHTHTMCRITDFTVRGVGPTSAVLGGGDRGTMFRSTCECCRFAAFRERERASGFVGFQHDDSISQDFSSKLSAGPPLKSED